MTVHRREDGTWSNAEADRVIIEPSRPNWPEAFEKEAQDLRRVLPFDTEALIEHFGSTAVPGLAAKPIIDILLIVRDQSIWPSLVQLIESLDYKFWAENPNRDRLFFVKGMPPFGEGRTHHIHVRAPEDAADALLFRDYLRSSPDAVTEYASLKRSLASEYRTDREAYTAAKDRFVRSALARARRAG